MKLFFREIRLSEHTEHMLKRAGKMFFRFVTIALVSAGIAGCSAGS